MAHSKELKQLKTNSLFSLLFPLKKGDRVKRKDFLPWKGKSYWVYGTVLKVIKVYRGVKLEEGESYYYRVLYDGRIWPVIERREKLVRVKARGRYR